MSIGGGGVAQSGRLLQPNSEAIFQTLLVCFIQRKRVREKRAKITSPSIQRAFWLPGPGGAEREAKGHIVPQ